MVGDLTGRVEGGVHRVGGHLMGLGLEGQQLFAAFQAQMSAQPVMTGFLGLLGRGALGRRRGRQWGPGRACRGADVAVVSLLDV